VEGVDELRVPHTEAAQEHAVALRQHERVAGREPGAVGEQDGALAPAERAGDPGRPQGFQEADAVARVEGGQTLGEAELRRVPPDHHDVVLGMEARQLAADG
jgi:hypothetical protein